MFLLCLPPSPSSPVSSILCSLAYSILYYPQTYTHTHTHTVEEHKSGQYADCAMDTIITEHQLKELVSLFSLPCKTIASLLQFPVFPLLHPYTYSTYCLCLSPSLTQTRAHTSMQTHCLYSTPGDTFAYLIMTYSVYSVYKNTYWFRLVLCNH